MPGGALTRARLAHAPDGVDARKGDRQKRVAERADVDGPGVDLARASRDEEGSRPRAEREDPLSRSAVGAAPDEDARRAELEAPQTADLHLERALDTAHALGRAAALGGVHCESYSLRGVRRSLALLLLLAALALGWAAPAAATTPPPVTARAVLVANGKTGEVLYERNANTRMAMASITKLMTAIVTLERVAPGEVVTVRGLAPSIGESSINLRSGEQLSVRDLLAAALIQSANDAAFALASYVADGNVSRFVRLMNEEADELGLEDTRYVRPDGLDTPGHYSSAEDTFALARRAMQEPLVRRIVRRRALPIDGGRTVRTWNDLLATFPGLVGVKTGHTDNAGWSQVAAARRHGTTIYAVILGSPSRAARNADLEELLEWGFDQYGSVTLVREGARYATAAIPFSDERVGLVAPAGAERVIRLDSGVSFVQRVVAPAIVDLPVDQGETLGEVVVLEGERVVARRPLVAAAAISAPSFGERVDWYADRALDEAGSMLGSVFGAFG